jgi:hypothetical protein
MKCEGFVENDCILITSVFWILCEALNCLDLDFSFLSNTYENSIHTSSWCSYSSIKAVREREREKQTKSFEGNEKQRDKRDE